MKGKTLDQAMSDPQHADRRGAGAAAGEDPLLDPRRGRDQGGGGRLPQEARHATRRRRRRASSRRTETEIDDGGHTDPRGGASTCRASSPSAARASACASACARPAARALRTSSSTPTTRKPEDVTFESHGVTVRRRPEEPAVSRRHRARLRARGPERRLQVQQPEREGRMRLRRILQRLGRWPHQRLLPSLGGRIRQ